MEDVTFVILGATGDLTKRKLLPAIYHLVKDKKLKNFVIIGGARSSRARTKILREAKTFIKKPNKAVWKKVEQAFVYQKLDFYNANNYDSFAALIRHIEQEEKLKGNRIFYLATLPEHFNTISKHLARTKIAKAKKQCWSRLVFEKPFGEDLKTAKQINKCLKRVFSEKQIYRIDHYLGKELVGNIALMRFTNRILEPLWSREHIEAVHIVLSERLDIKHRAAFYDKYGALKDVVQNHALQLLALTAMESPRTINGNSVRAEKAKILKKTKIKDFLLAQYQGYGNTRGVKLGTNTETFAALHCRINNKRWKGVPFYIKVGKALDKKEVTIYVKFKKVACKLSSSCPSSTNAFIMRVQPNSGFSLELNAKLPRKNQVTPVKMDFCEDCYFGPNSPQAYEVLLADVIAGNQSTFVRNDEIEYAWRIIDAVEKRKRGKKIYKYKKGSSGPKQLRGWEKKHKLHWIP